MLRQSVTKARQYVVGDLKIQMLQAPVPSVMHDIHTAWGWATIFL